MSELQRKNMLSSDKVKDIVNQENTRKEEMKETPTHATPDAQMG